MEFLGSIPRMRLSGGMKVSWSSDSAASIVQEPSGRFAIGIRIGIPGVDPPDAVERRLEGVMEPLLQAALLKIVIRPMKSLE